jgi:pilus assembly protein FimV
MKTAVRRILLMSALMSPGALYALGLGEIHLNSALNQPFDADIELVSATQEDLGALRAALANSETFTRYGLDRPAYLSDFTFRVAKGSGGQDVLKVTSPRPVTEPFVTLLVEASWTRGRLLREYTVLLDPPVFAPTPAAAEPPVATPRASSAPAPSARPETFATEPAAPAPAAERREPRTVAASSPGIEPGSTYRVQPNDTLWQIASAANPGSRSDVNRAMVAIFQGNPQAFAGNINVLRSGSELKIPQSGEIAAISASAASAEVARQYQMWKEGSASSETAGGGEPAGRLRLVTPDQGTAAPSTSTTVPPTGSQTEDLKARVGQLESELAEARRLLEVRNAELATLQGQVAGATPAAGTPGTSAPPAAAPTEVPVEPSATTAPVAEPAAPVKTEPAKPTKPEKRKKTPPPAHPEGPSLFERLAQYWWALLGLFAIAAAWLFFRRLREGQRGASESDLEEALGGDLRSAARVPLPTGRPSRESDIVVEEKRPVETAATPLRVPETTRRPVSVEDTISGEGAASIEASDPLAEADFHMAYGLYDQAADLVQLAIKREPRRRDLKLKLLEIFFVWGNRDRFLELAREMNASRADAPSGEWDKVLIMGKQIAPEDGLFAGTPRAAAGDLDMELHGGTGMFDMNLDPGALTPPDMDLTIGAPKITDHASLDFVLDEPQRGAADPASLAPTVESPRINRYPGLDDTEEVPIESLGLEVDSLADLEELEKTQDLLAPRSIARAEDTAENPVLRSLVEDTVENPAIRPDERADETVEEDLLSSTGLMKMSETLVSAAAGNTSETAVFELPDVTSELPTIQAARLDVQGGLPADYSLGEEAATMSEVGTKLDLARAYIDMGDPEGARAILDEVLHEGNAAQKQEAQRLMASLP